MSMDGKTAWDIVEDVLLGMSAAAVLFIWVYTVHQTQINQAVAASRYKYTLILWGNEDVPTEAQLIRMIRGSYPQTACHGWHGKEQCERYYTPGQVRIIAQSILAVAAKYDIPPLYLAANLAVQSRFQYDAVSATNDYGIAQLHCPKKGVCGKHPTKGQLARLFDPIWSIDRFGQWVAAYRKWCAVSADKGKAWRKCNRNYVYTGIPGWIGVALKKTSIFIRKYRMQLRKMKGYRVL